jgi:hypothetical protein
MLVVDLPDGGIVSRFETDEQLIVWTSRRLPKEKLLKNGWREFASASAAVRQIG